MEPDLGPRLRQLLAWAQAERLPAREDVQRTLAHDGIVAVIVERFASLIGLWPGNATGQHQD